MSAASRAVLGLALLGLFAVGASVAGQDDEWNLNEDGLVLQGYDAVAYVDEGQAVRGNPRWSVKYAKALYLFATVEHRDRFMRSPPTYEPQYGGWCAFGMGMDPEETGHPRGKYPVDPDKFKVVEGKLYLFFNEEGYDARQMWNRDEERLRAEADSFWADLIENSGAGETDSGP